jgi:hypothetical protein
MKKRIIAVTLIMAILGVFTLPSALAQPAPGGLTIPLTGTFTDALGGTGHFVGTFSVQRFAQDNNQIVAVGTLTGTLTDSVGTVLGSIVRTISLILNSAATQASCEILHLELGPLDLNLLLGNLLCAIANLLNAGGALAQIINLLNQILAQL